VTLSRKNVEEYVTSLETTDEMRRVAAQNIETSFKELDSQIEKGDIPLEFAKSAAMIQKMSLPTSSAILDSLSGQIYASAQALTFQQSETVNKDLSNRLVMLGTLDNLGEKAGIWVTGIGSNGRLRRDGYGVGKSRLYGGQVGIDRVFGNSLILGTALSYSRTDVKFDRYGGESKGTNFGVSLYGRLGNKEVPYYLQGRIGVGFVDSDVERDILLGTGSVTRAKINHDDRVYSGYLESGYNFIRNGMTLTPFVGLSHDTVVRGSFREENSQFGLSSEKAKYHQTSGLLGLRLGKKMVWSNGIVTTIQGYVTHQMDFKEEDLSFEASYTGLSGAKFRVRGIGLPKDRTWTGLGVLTEVNPNISWYVNYDAKIEKKKINNNVFTTGFRINF
ncbi:autotransporter domain-containing protein, partial [Leptotrichia sp. OH3620_COT-345]|uniref:autotransporter outer membrane beta-barrel domain-containing protein n=1 Tax=Leptotrichia sp. OH3620_COT-345 TaxID=2491048 RepID=UPI000F651591